MMVTAKLKYLRIAPRKVRLVTDLIKGKKVAEALSQLKFIPKKAALPIIKLLNSAVANAKYNFQIEENNLYISKITVDEGPKYKRWRAQARGRAAEIQKKTSHITVILEESEKQSKKNQKDKKLKESEVAKVERIKKEKKDRIKPAEKGFLPKFGEKKKALKLKPERETTKLKSERGLKRVFRRKAF